MSDCIEIDFAIEKGAYDGYIYVVLGIGSGAKFISHQYNHRGSIHSIVYAIHSACMREDFYPAEIYRFFQFLDSVSRDMD